MSILIYAVMLACACAFIALVGGLAVIVWRAGWQVERENENMKDRPQSTLQPAGSSSKPPLKPPIPRPEGYQPKAPPGVDMEKVKANPPQGGSGVRAMLPNLNDIGQLQARLAIIEGCAAARLDCIERLEGEIESLRKNLESQLDWWYQIPVGVDEEADIENAVPDDQTAHIAGLAVQEIRRALADPK